MATNWHDLHHSWFKGTHAVVTGGAGFIGSHLADALVSLGARVTVFDDLSAGFAVNVPVDSRFIHASILDREALHDAMSGARFVFHEAALGSVPRSVEMPDQYVDVNVRGTCEVLRACAESGVERVIFAASSSAYGDTVELPKCETMLPMPRNPYAATKVADEALMRSWSHSYGLDTVCLRYFNVFGPRQNANSAYAAVIAAFATCLLQGERPTIFGDGTQSRDFTHVDNAVHANLLAARSSFQSSGEIINIACGGRVSLTDLARLMAQVVGRPDLKPIFAPARRGDVLHSHASIEKAHRLLDYSPIVSVRDGLVETIRWYESQLETAGQRRGSISPFQSVEPVARTA